MYLKNLRYRCTIKDISVTLICVQRKLMVFFFFSISSILTHSLLAAMKFTYYHVIRLVLLLTSTFPQI